MNDKQFETESKTEPTESYEAPAVLATYSIDELHRDAAAAAVSPA